MITKKAAIKYAEDCLNLIEPELKKLFFKGTLQASVIPAYNSGVLVGFNIYFNAVTSQQAYEELFGESLINDLKEVNRKIVDLQKSLDDPYYYRNEFKLSIFEIGFNQHNYLFIELNEYSLGQIDKLLKGFNLKAYVCGDLDFEKLFMITRNVK